MCVYKFMDLHTVGQACAWTSVVGWIEPQLSTRGCVCAFMIIEDGASLSLSQCRAKCMHAGKRQAGEILSVPSDGRCFSSAWCASKHPELWAVRAGIEVWAGRRCMCTKVNLRAVCTSTTAALTFALRLSMPRRPTATLLISDTL